MRKFLFKVWGAYMSHRSDRLFRSFMRKCSLLTFVFMFCQLNATNVVDIDSVVQNGLKQKRIDACIVSKIHEITSDYDDALLAILKQGDMLMKGKNDAMTNSRLLSVFLGNLNQCLLIDLWTHVDIQQVLRCIEMMSYMQNFWESSEEKYEGYDWDKSRLFKILTQPFAHSRTLMGIEGSKLIMTLIDSDFYAKGYELQRERLNPNSGEIDSCRLLTEISSSKGKAQFWSTNCYKFKYSLGGVEQYTIDLLNKSGGCQFGGVFEVIFDSQRIKRYYCKAYWGYPAKGDFNSEKAFASSISFVRSNDIVDGKIENAYSPLDFKELFVYKALEFLEIGPKVRFFKVPVLKDSFFILTEDLSTNNVRFIEMGKIDNKLETRVNSMLLDIQGGDMGEDSYEQFNALTGLLELDTINRIFNLHDSNDGNFGYLAEVRHDASHTSIAQEAAINWLKEEHNFKIIDFIAPFTSSSYEVEDIFQTFLAGNTLTKYLSGHLMDYAICRHVDGRSEELIRKNNAEKISFGKRVIDALEKRFEKYGNLERLLNNAKEDVLAFLRNVKCPELSGDTVEKGARDIEVYIRGIVTNYSKLKECIGNYEIES